jgi:transcription-repair coupling factor (superfamily II helicase)
MASDTTAATAPDRLFQLVQRLEAQEGFAEVVESLKAGHAATLDGVWGSSCALAAAALARHAPAVLVVVCARLDQVDALADDLALFTPIQPERFAVRESLAVGWDEQTVTSGGARSRPNGLQAPPKSRDLDPPYQDVSGGARSRPNGLQAPPKSRDLDPPYQEYQDEGQGDRVRLLKLLAAGAQPQAALGGPPPPKIILASIQSLLSPVPSREALARQTRLLRVGEEVSLEELSGWLVRAGFQNTTAVQLPGEFALRGGILDIFAPDWYDPVRVELAGDQIESLRRFEVSSQRSLAALQEIDVTAVADGQSSVVSGQLSPDPPTRFAGTPGCPADHGQRTTDNLAHLADYLPPASWFLLIEPGDLESEGRQYLDRLERPAEFHTVAAVLQRSIAFPSVTASGVAAGSLETTCRLAIESVERFSGDIQRVRSELDEAGAGQEVFLVCQTEAEVRRLGEVLGGTRVAREGRLHFPVGNLQNGFRLVPDRIVLLSSGELFRRADVKRPAGTREVGRRRRAAWSGRAIDSFLDLHAGDLVVHVAHGIARYRGLKLLEKAGQVEEHLELEFQGRTKLYVPAARIALVQKYVGGQKSRPTLARLGGRAWEKQKEKVRAAVTDLAAEMLDLQAVRAARPGIRFTVNTEWQHEFDAAFAYQETPDQLSTMEAIQHDMSQPRPMDRLLCGDVGYGKTEVAMRAAFKAVDSGYQVAVLVPTTVLAEQHLRTFTARMAEFPFEIAALSRFATRRQQARIIERLEAGSLDIVIGTHRLVQPDVRFHNLGLVIIDEEQRFGVEVKERLKAFRQIVDVLTMTATPIPRTLHMGLVGLRDISNLETPPEDRLAVETRVARFHPELIRQSVMRELNRGGQIYFVHNRIQDIEVLARRLRQVVPEARLAVAHGQMPEHELERAMLAFIDHRFDLLLATTIVESGLDIPNANTIFIDEADRYGLADLHQLRGRVGRYKHRAYCYLLVDPGKHLSPSAARRLRAIEEFSDMGAGFAIAMRDLEIRGAGNILGTQQSGHIATVGYELYCSLLEHAVTQLKHVPPKEAIEVEINLPGEGYIPRSYVPDMRLGIDLYRRLARVSTRAELEDFRGELLDRFGAPPPLVEHLLWLAELRIAAHQWGIESIRVEDQYVVFRYTSRRQILELAAISGGKLRVVDAQSAYLPLDGQGRQPETIRRQVKSLLQPS